MSVTKLVQYTNRPNQLDVIELPDGNFDIWCRKNISEKVMEEGESKQTVYEVEEEAYGFATPQQKHDIVDGHEFDAIFNIVATWIPDHPEVHNIDPVEQLEKQVETLNQQNAMLTDCILELSTIVYQ